MTPVSSATHAPWLAGISAVERLLPLEVPWESELSGPTPPAGGKIRRLFERTYQGAAGRNPGAPG